MPTLHILSNPSSPVNLNNRVDAFAVLAYKFIKYMTRYGWKCIHYGVVGCDVDCETVVCNDSIIHQQVDTIRYNQNAIREIGLRKQPGDMILCFHGIQNQDCTQAHQDLKIVEPSIGYAVDAVFAPYRVFASYAHMHMYYGHKNMLMTPSWFDAVIPNAVTASEFEYSEHKQDYLLYFGRIIESKGLHVAIQASEKANRKLVVAGPGSLESIGYSSIPKHVEVVGVCDAEQRKALMRDAQAIIGPTYYVEPFGNMVVEGYMSGTPAITTDWGGFTETVVQGITGFRCREFREFVQAIELIDSINPKACRDWAVENYDDEVVHVQFDEYFKKLADHDFYRL